MWKPALLATATLLATYLFTRLRYLRYRQYAYLPQLPSNLLLGHLKAFGEFSQRGITDRHPDAVFEEMWEAKGRPAVIFFDMRPIAPPLLLITHHEVAEQISKPTKLHPWTTTKSPTFNQLIPLAGHTSILAKEGQDWKDLRKRYNPDFSAYHLWTLFPTILEKMEPFLEYLDQYAASGESFSLERLVSNLTFDVIGAAALEVDLNSQQMDRSKQGEITRSFADMLQTHNDDKTNLPWWVVPLTTWRRYRLADHVDSLIKDIIKQKYPELKKSVQENKSRSIVALSLQDTETLTPELLTETADQVRTFLFAGHDSNSSALQWIFYELSRTPRALKAVRDDLDEVLGPGTDPRAVSAALIQNAEQVFPRLNYLNAVIKETLRLHPPASTVRMTAPGTGFTISLPTGEEYLADGLVLYACQSVIHRDPAVFGDNTNDWVPERWLGEATKSIPSSAWRPFERGPKNCMGLELANMESRIIVAIVARKYDFIKIGLGERVLDEKGFPILNDKGQYRAKSELYNTRRMTAKPVDGTIMKVKVAAGS
ncbi:hypothetical protein S40293_04497 [Stachybotrys chartarum IBT 40293]|nr:hypothetical protein S40293_04497 [Stachybotrys chartarum IBT 40293]